MLLPAAGPFLRLGYPKEGQASTKMPGDARRFPLFGVPRVGFRCQTMPTFGLKVSFLPLMNDPQLQRWPLSSVGKHPDSCRVVPGLSPGGSFCIFDSVLRIWKAKQRVGLAKSESGKGTQKIEVGK